MKKFYNLLRIAVPLFCLFSSITGISQSSMKIENSKAIQTPQLTSGSHNKSAVSNAQGVISGSCSTTIIHSADFESNLDGWTDGGADAARVNYASRSYSNNYSLSIQDNSGVASAFTSPLFDLSAYDKVDFKFFFTAYSVENGENFFIEYSSDSGANWSIVNDYKCGDVVSKDADYESTTSIIFYSKTSTLLKTNYSFPATTTSQFRVRSDASTNDDLVYIDNITITGTSFCTPTKGPGGITADLDLWLKADQLDGVTVGTDGALVSKWTDNGKGNHAETVVSGLEPVYRNNTTRNINFNPVIDFENDNTTANRDMTYIINDGSRDELKGTSGFNNDDIFVVLMPDPTITTSMIPLDTFCSTDPAGNTQNEDVTGFGYGGYTARFSNELFTYCNGTTSGLGNGYGRTSKNSSIDYNQISIINTRHNSTNTGIELFLNNTQIGTDTSDAADYATVNDMRFWLGRSQYWNGSFDGRIAEVITFSATKNNANLTVERNRIQSYLGIKYGVTLGVNGTSQDYVNSDGTVIWDQSANTGYNYDVAGMGRDDASELNQKQSSSSNDATDVTGPIEGILTMGLTDIYDTNSDNVSSNPTTFNDKEFLTWGNNGVDLDLAATTVSVNMSANITPSLTTNVTFTAMQRIWKVVENGGDIPKVKVSIPQNAVRNINPPGSYLMFISDTGVFDPTADYKVMTQVGGNLEALYDFDGTKYITFGYAPQVIEERSVYFDGVSDYIDMEDALNLNSTEFTISSWIKRDTGTINASILSKRDVGYTEGYDMKINGSGNLEMSWNGGSESLTSSVSIPEDKWHHLAVIYEAGTATLYIDGIADTSAAKANPVATSQSFFVAAAGKNAPTAYFKGNIDEVRIWNIALTKNQLRYIMNQEIEDNSSFVNGKVLPQTITKNEVSSIPWTDLAGYYPMSIYTYTNTNDESGNGNQGALRNLMTVDRQSAPLPYISQANGDWTTNATWLNNTVQTLPNALSIVDGAKSIDWNIVQTDHNIDVQTYTDLGRERSVQGLMVNSGEIQVSGDTGSKTGNGFTVTHYLKLDGKIDLNGESQLVQTLDSDLDVTSAGTLERDQQGTQDLFTYNYWSSAVGVSNITTNNNSYTLPDVYFDGTTPSSPTAINYITNSYDGTSGTPIGIADYWIWKYSNLEDDYYNWQHIRSTGSLLAGEGFTMKGVNNTSGNLSLEQNYVMEGKPNNGQINLPISEGNEYLVGNPYASALDAHQFIMDNAPTIEGTGNTTGTLYFWEHWGGGSHVTAEYQGGYATYNLSGATPAASYGTNDPDVGTGGTPTKLPGRYIPVAQGFFVTGENTGTIKFNNGQRIFQKEGSSSVFVRQSSENIASVASTNQDADDRMKLRIGFNSVNTIHRQLLVTVDNQATAGYDWGYDGKNNETQMDDFYWMINNEKYVLQGIDTINEETIIPLGLHTANDGINTITIDALENVPSDLAIYAHDLETGIYHDLRQSDYQVNLTAGEYLTRFELTFSTEDALSIDGLESETGIQFYFANDNQSIIVNNPKLQKIESLEIYSILGQSILKYNSVETQDYTRLKTNSLSTGNYILEIKTEIGSFSKKVLVE